MEFSITSELAHNSYVTYVRNESSARLRYKMDLIRIKTMKLMMRKKIRANEKRKLIKLARNLNTNYISSGQILESVCQVIEIGKKYDEDFAEFLPEDIVIDAPFDAVQSYMDVQRVANVSNIFHLK